VRWAHPGFWTVMDRTSRAASVSAVRRGIFVVERREWVQAPSGAAYFAPEGAWARIWVTFAFLEYLISLLLSAFLHGRCPD
jgi:hypothetical protein